MFLAPSAKTRDRIQKKLSVAKIVLTSSICMQSLVEIDKRTATGERKTQVFLFVCHATGVGAARRRTVFVDVGVSLLFINRF